MGKEKNKKRERKRERECVCVYVWNKVLITERRESKPERKRE